MRILTEEQRLQNIKRASLWNANNKNRRRKQKCNTPEYLRQLRYGLTPEQYKQMYDNQKGLCKISSCGRPIKFVDHNHETNEVRALLCKGCNSALGMFRDRPDLMREAAEYIEHFNLTGGIPIVIPPKNSVAERSRGNTWRRGAVLSDETKLKISETAKKSYADGREVWNSGKPWPDETRKKMSESAKRRWSSNKEI